MRRRWVILSCQILVLAAFAGLWIRYTGGERVRGAILLEALRPTDEILGKREDWMAVRYQKRRVGYMHTSVTTEMIKTADDVRVARIRVESAGSLTLMAYGQSRTIRFSGSSFFNEEQRPYHFRFSMGTKPYAMEVEGNAVGKHLQVLVRSLNSEQRLRIPLSDLNLSDIFAYHLRFQDLRVGDRWAYSLFNPQTLSTSPAELQVESKTTVDWEGEKRDVFIVRQDYLGLTVRMWVGTDGTVLREQSPIGFSYERVSREKALEPVSEEVDIISATAIKPAFAVLPQAMGYIRVPRKIRKMTLRIQGIDDPKLILQDPRQKVEQRKDGWYYTVLAVSPRSKGFQIPVRDPALAEYLRAEPLIETDDPAIRRQAAKAIGRARHTWTAALAINRWVFKNLAKIPTITPPSALAALKSREGDCNEHTALFIAMARAAGIPAKMTVGVVLQDRKFYYHAWPEVYVNGWFALDPTFGQDRVDASHVKLAEGNLGDQVRIAQVVNKLAIRIIDVE